MKKIILVLFLACPGFLFAQIGLKAGLNFANVTKASSINNSSRSGFHAGILFNLSKGIIGSRTELIFSRQGYDYKTNTNTGSVDLDYIMLPQYLAINITKFFQIQVGGQIAYLLNAKADSANNSGGSGNPYGKILDFYNKFDFGYGGGIEIHPVKGLLIGARINISLGNMYKDFTTDPSGSGSGSGSEPTPSFIPKVDIKNNVFQVYTGWKFGGKKKTGKKK